MGLDMYYYAKTKKRVIEPKKVDGCYEDNYKSYCHWRAEDDKTLKDETNYPEELKELGDYIYRTNFKSSFNNKYGKKYYQIGYFRKFNALHKFMCDLDKGRDECQEIKMTKTKLTKLLGILYQVNADEELAPELLPTEHGFFFGCCDYDEWYFDDVKDAIEMCELFLEKFDFENYDLIYKASW